MMALHHKAVPRLFFKLRWRLGRFLETPFPFVSSSDMLAIVMRVVTGLRTVQGRILISR